MLLSRWLVPLPLLCSAAIPRVMAAESIAEPSNHHIKTVWVIVMENQDWSSIKGSKFAPYISGTLLPEASHTEQYFNPPRIHPSLPNYLWMEAGTNFGIADNRSPLVRSQSTPEHLVALLKNAPGGGVEWRAYQENIPGNQCPLSDRYPYAVKHDPFVYFDDVTNRRDPSSSYCIAHVRPFEELSKDLADHSVARYNFITPNLCDDMHDSCSPLRNRVAQGDTWLAKYLPEILNSRAFSDGGAVFLTWDEGERADGPIGMIVLSPLAKGRGYSNSIHYDHGALLRTLEEIFGVMPYLGNAASQPDLSDLFSAFP
ncbi:MAG TPA: alkaline phosphatase family protein [Terriglobales bacterium]|nr:alkaline phosphatase family protein [Terriglobales bacterium]